MFGFWVCFFECVILIIVYMQRLRSGIASPVTHVCFLGGGGGGRGSGGMAGGNQGREDEPEEKKAVNHIAPCHLPCGTTCFQGVTYRISVSRLPWTAHCGSF